MRPPESHSTLSKELHGLLGGFDADDPRDLDLLRRLVDHLGEAALPELSDRMVRPTTPRGLRRAIIAEVGRHPDFPWVPLLSRGLMHEPDPLVFEEGCRALAQLGSEAAADALRQVGRQRVEGEFAGILQRKLDWLESRMPFSYHFRDLLLGNSQPKLARAAAERLGALCGTDNLAELSFACQHPDPLSSRLAHRILGAMPFPEAARALVESFREVHRELALDARLREVLDRARKAGDRLNEVLLGALRAAVPEAAGAALEALENAVKAKNEDLGPEFARLREAAPDADLRLIQIAELALQGRKWSAPAAEFLQATRASQARLSGILDEAGEGIAYHARRGDLPFDEALGLLEEAFKAEVGGEGLARAFASLLKPEDEERLALVLACTVQSQRQEAYEILAGQGDPRLTAFFLKATEDPITDLAQLAVRVLGGLPGGYELGVELLGSGHPGQIEKALLLFGANRMVQAVPLILDLVRETEREDLLLGALETLGELGAPEALEPLVDLIRGGQSPRVLATLITTLGRLGRPEGIRALIQRVPELRQPELMLLSLEAAAAVHGRPDSPLPADLVAPLEAMLGTAWAEGDGARLRAAPAAAGIEVGDPGYARRLRDRLEEVLAQQRKQPTLPRDRFQVLVGVGRDLDRRLGASEDRVKQEALLVSRIEALTTPQWRDAQVLARLLASLSEEPGPLGPAARKLLADRLREVFEVPAGLSPGTLEQLIRLIARSGEAELGPLLRGLARRINPGSQLGRILAEAFETLNLDRGPLEAVRELLLLEPSDFFRRRLVQALSGWELREVRDRDEAEAQIRARPVDCLISEWTDAQGPLEAWLRETWISGRVAGVLVVAADRGAERALGEPWCRGILLKPFGPEALLAYLPRPE